MTLTQDAWSSLINTDKMKHCSNTFKGCLLGCRPVERLTPSQLMRRKPFEKALSQQGCGKTISGFLYLIWQASVCIGSFIHVILRNPLRRRKMSGRRLNYSVAHPRSWVGCQPPVFHSPDTSFPNSGVYLLSVLSDNGSQELIHLWPGDWKDFHKDWVKSRIPLNDHYEIYAKISAWPPYIAYLQSSR